MESYSPAGKRPAAQGFIHTADSKIWCRVYFGGPEFGSPLPVAHTRFQGLLKESYGGKMRSRLCLHGPDSGMASHTAGFDLPAGMRPGPGLQHIGQS